MTKLQNGAKAVDFTFDTPWSESNDLYETLEGKKTILLFLRYYGCSLCQLDIAALVSESKTIESNDAQVLVVLQTEASFIREQLTQEQMPLTLICDPEHKLFDLYGVEAGKTQEDLISEEAMKKLAIAKEKGILNLGNKGEQLEFQLPATFIISPDGTIEYSRYGTHAADIPSPAELIELTLNVSVN
ncbi:alkyl hydroperoxide reductase [Sporosarcina sp. BI001-red]|uniref:redoxin domain-containing protein n=1 Tax=Sporosarcina sp. BI001-red TaxID=2282866 RepID=UPI000E224801|nr:redoxin domain-containing protein [Sporosarcina sp. BI001-red]REB08761.1 alkyl hydroperoxide reductase [Sporosarcina sp. BI001-red]